MGRTGTLGRLFGHQPEPTLDLYAQDMIQLGLKDGDLVRLSSRRDNLVLPALASDRIAPTQAHAAMHWATRCWPASARQSRPDAASTA